MYASYDITAVIEGLPEGLDADDIDMILYKNLKHSQISISIVEAEEEE